MTDILLYKLKDKPPVKIDIKDNLNNASQIGYNHLLVHTITKFISPTDALSFYATNHQNIKLLNKYKWSVPLNLTTIVKMLELTYTTKRYPIIQSCELHADIEFIILILAFLFSKNASISELMNPFYECPSDADALIVKSVHLLEDSFFDKLENIVYATSYTYPKMTKATGYIYPWNHTSNMKILWSVFGKYYRDIAFGLLFNLNLTNVYLEPFELFPARHHYAQTPIIYNKELVICNTLHTLSVSNSHMLVNCKFPNLRKLEIRGYCESAILNNFPLINDLKIHCLKPDTNIQLNLKSFKLNTLYGVINNNFMNYFINLEYLEYNINWPIDLHYFSKLQTVKFGFRFNQSIDYKLPDTLQELYIGEQGSYDSSFNCPIMILPKNLKILSIYARNMTACPICVVPLKLETFLFCGSISYRDNDAVYILRKFPETVKHITIHTPNILIKQLPSQLQTLNVWFAQGKLKCSLPKTLNKLEIYTNHLITLNKFCNISKFPPNLSHINISYSSNITQMSYIPIDSDNIFRRLIKRISKPKVFKMKIENKVIKFLKKGKDKGKIICDKNDKEIEIISK